MVNMAKTGIKGFDSMLKGGVPEGNQIILAGGPGAGKTLMSFEFLYRNAKMGNKGILFTLDEEPANIVNEAKLAFSDLTDIDDLLESGMITIEKEDLSVGTKDESQLSYEFGRIVSDIEAIINKTGAKRVVIDTITVLSMLVSDPIAYRRSMLALVSNLRRIGVLSIMTAELPSPERTKLEFKPEFFLADGIAIMYQTGEEARRMLALEIIKMRGSDHSFVTTPYEITSSGFRITSVDDIAKLD
jgi:circadian clock protein KaiC